MRNENKGSILIITLGFVFVFTLLGFGSLHYVYVQNEIVEKEKASAEAFWLADGALQMAFNKVKANSTDLITKGMYTPNAQDLKQYDVYSEVDPDSYCPPQICTDPEREQDPELPVCTEAQRLLDPILCTDAQRAQDHSGICPSTPLVIFPPCTQEEKDANGGLCPCQVNASCTWVCPCTADGTCPGAGRCLCEYDPDVDPCDGRCPCEITESCPCHQNDPPSCPCGQNDPDTCTGSDKMTGRCPCEVVGNCCSEKFVLHSYGEVNYNAGVESRALIAEAGEDNGGCDLDNAIETWGWVNKDHDCLPDGAAIIGGGCEQTSDFSFESVFDEDQQFFIDNANYTYLNPDNNFDGTVGGITYITMTGSNKSLNITEDKLEDTNPADGIPDAALLIIDTTGVDPNKNVMITIAGNGLFRGIVWIIGEAQIVGTSSIYGAVFVAGDDTEETKVSGTTDIYHDWAAIREALGTIFPDGCQGEAGEGWSTDLTFNSWKEITTNKADY